MIQLDSLPYEILDSIIMNLKEKDLSAISLVSRQFRTLINSCTLPNVQDYHIKTFKYLLSSKTFKEIEILTILKRISLKFCKEDLTKEVLIAEGNNLSTVTLYLVHNFNIKRSIYKNRTKNCPKKIPLLEDDLSEICDLKKFF